MSGTWECRCCIGVSGDGVGAVGVVLVSVEVLPVLMVVGLMTGVVVPAPVIVASMLVILISVSMHVVSVPVPVVSASITVITEFPSDERARASAIGWGEKDSVSAELIGVSSSGVA